mgnify:CR=1 FL=1
MPASPSSDPSSDPSAPRIAASPPGDGAPESINPGQEDEEEGRYGRAAEEE